MIAAAARVVLVTEARSLAGVPWRALPRPGATLVTDTGLVPRDRERLEERGGAPAPDPVPCAGAVIHTCALPGIPTESLAVGPGVVALAPQLHEDGDRGEIIIDDLPLGGGRHEAIAPEEAHRPSNAIHISFACLWKSVELKWNSGATGGSPSPCSLPSGRPLLEKSFSARRCHSRRMGQ